MKTDKVTASELIDMLRPYDNWRGDKNSPRNLQAKIALQSVLARYKAAPLDECFIFGKMDAFAYILRMLPVRAALLEQDYQLACNELMNLLHHENVFQRHIHSNVVALLDEYLTGE